MSGKDDNDDKDKKKEPTFLEGYEYLDDLIKDRMNRRKEIDQQLEAASKDPSTPNKHTLKYSPPGFTTGRPSANQEFQLQQLKAEKTQIDADIHEIVEGQINVLETDPETAAQIRQTLTDKMYPNLFEGKGEKELRQMGKMEKDINTSQDYMRVQLKNFKEGTPKNSKSPEEIRKESVQTEKEFNSSQEFMQRQIDAFRERGTEKPSKEPPKEEAKGQPTLSARFSQSLSYTKALEKPAEKPTPNKGKDDKSPDKD